MKRWQHLTVSLLAGLALLAMAAALGVQHLNRGLQRDIGMRQQYVQQSLQLETLYREIIRSLAELGARNNDDQVRSMLQRHGITYTVNTPAPANASPQPEADGKSRKSGSRQ